VAGRAAEVVATDRVDVCVVNRRNPGERFIVGDDVRLLGLEVVDGSVHVAGVPDLDGVDEGLQAQRVALVVVFVGWQLGAEARRSNSSGTSPGSSAALITGRQPICRHGGNPIGAPSRPGLSPLNPAAMAIKGD
jgi:hypothetical protein